MRHLLNYPIITAVVSLLVMWGAAELGARLAHLRRQAGKELEGFNIVLGATLTLLGLIVGFAFSMAVGRYDQRKSYEEEEANAIGTEYVRVDLLSPADAGKLHPMLKRYLDRRIVFYQTRDSSELEQVHQEVVGLQDKMWSTVVSAAQVQPTPITALVVAGMNDVLNRQGYTQAAWWNRIPVAAWALIGIIAICCNVLMGFTVHDTNLTRPLFVLPLVLAIAFMLLADLDSPRGGIIRVRPQNLISLADSLK